MPGRGAALEDLDDDHASSAAWTRQGGSRGYPVLPGADPWRIGRRYRRRFGTVWAFGFPGFQGLNLKPGSAPHMGYTAAGYACNRARRRDPRCDQRARAGWYRRLPGSKCRTRRSRRQDTARCRRAHDRSSPTGADGDVDEAFAPSGAPASMPTSVPSSKQHAAAQSAPSKPSASPSRIMVLNNGCVPICL
jgi:hypothetical protein